jgi:cell wall-associated NlpC family hydrolase
MKKFAFILIFCIPISYSWTQVLEFDKLEMRYDQGHYRSVYRKARQFLDKPQYDFSYLPSYYLAISKLQLAQNDWWYKNHKYAVVEAKRTLLELQKTIEGKQLLEAHRYEMSALKSDLQQWLSDLKIKEEKSKLDLVNSVLVELFEDVPDIIELQQDEVVVENNEEITSSEITNANVVSEPRKKLLERSEELLGVPYQWAGTTPNGFDCSGFTSYLMDTELNKTLDRRAVDQYNSAKKIKKKHIKPGDFVFFDNGSGISHVGVVFSTNNNSIQMIHASTSVGVSIVDIYQSSYWKQRVAGFGSYIED